MFSGPYRAHREGGLSKTLEAFGWDSVTDFDNDRELGGGWQDVGLRPLGSKQWIALGASMHPATGVGGGLSQCATPSRLYVGSRCGLRPNLRQTPAACVGSRPLRVVDVDADGENLVARWIIVDEHAIV